MSLKPLQITFHLDGSGIYYDPREPIHLDGLLAWALAPMHCAGDPPARDEVPAEIPLPLGRWEFHGAWGWCASALFPDGPQAESLHFWRKRFCQSRAELTTGTPNLQRDTYREYNMPLPLLLVPRMIAWALGDRKRVAQILRKNVRCLGKKRAYGHGQVTEIVVEWTDVDYSLSRDGGATRWLPCQGGLRIVRPRAPYWNRVGAIRCCEISARWPPTEV